MQRSQIRPPEPGTGLALGASSAAFTCLVQAAATIQRLAEDGEVVISVQRLSLMVGIPTSRLRRCTRASGPLCQRLASRRDLLRAC